jgi:hypothetical protein
MPSWRSALDHGNGGGAREIGPPRGAWAAMAGLAAALALAPAASGGPPFLNDDPDPTEPGHWETCLFSVLDWTRAGATVQAPAFEVNYGVSPETQAHFLFPFVSSVPDAGGAKSAFGGGDTEVALKYRFLKETDSTPAMAVFPTIEAPTGDAGRGLGNGRTWAKFPLLIQKGWEPWTAIGSAGMTLNTAPGQRAFPYGGALLLRDCGEHLTLGGEIFARGKPSADEAGSVIANFGGYLNFTKDFSLLFSAGHSIAGERTVVAYLGLFHGW